MKQTLPYLYKTFIIALSYAALSRSAFLLSIPPESVGVLWPSACLSLIVILMTGLRYIPAILAGAFIATYAAFIGMESSPVTGSNLLYLIVAISMVLTFQPWASAQLAKKLIPVEALPPRNCSDLITFIIIAGGLGTFLGATVGCLVLVSFNALPWSGFLNFQLEWWVGDFFGVAVFAPIAFSLLDKQSTLLRKLIMVVPTVVLLSLIVASYFTAKNDEIMKRKLLVDSATHEFSRELEKELQSYLGILSANERFIVSSEYVSAEEFKLFTEKSFSEHKGLVALSWMPKVTLSQREETVSSIQNQGYPKFDIKVRQDYRILLTSGQSNIYYPVVYVEPYEANKRLHGIDVYAADPISGRTKQKALDMARDNAQPVVTEIFPLVQNENIYGVTIYHPVYSKNVANLSTGERRRALRGFTGATFTLDGLLSSLKFDPEEAGFDLIINDVMQREQRRQVLFDSGTSKALGEEHFIYSLSSEMFNADDKVFDGMLPDWRTTATIPISIAGRVWDVSLIQKKAEPFIKLWWQLVIGFALASMFTTFLFWVSSHVDEMHPDMEKFAQKSDALFAKSFAISIVFSIFTVSFFVSEALKKGEEETIKSLILEEVDLVKKSIYNQLTLAIGGLKRMEQRWEFEGGTPYEKWADDARRLVADYPALTTLEWVDEYNIIQWIEPLEGNEEAVGLNVGFEEKRRSMLESAMVKGHVSMTAPFNLVQGYRAFITYVPIYIHENFDGFIVGIYDVEKFVKNILPKEQLENFYLIIQDGNETVFDNSTGRVSEESLVYSSEINLKIYGRKWTISLAPMDRYLAYRASYVGIFTLAIGTLIAFLSGLAIYATLISYQRNQAIKYKTLALEESRTRMHAIVDNALDGLVTVDNKGKITSYNKASERIFGYMREDVIGKSYQILLPDEDSVLDEEYWEYQKNSKGGIDKGRLGFFRELRAMRKNGEIFPAEVSISKVIMPQDAVYSAIIRDITKRKRMMDALTSSNEELERFAYACSHDLQEPLRMVRSFAEKLGSHLTDRIKGDEKGTRYMKYIMDGAERSQELVHGILSYSSLDWDAQHHEEVDLNRMLALIKDTMEVTLKSGCEISSGELPTVMGNTTQIYQLMQNIISNGLKYQKAGELPKVHLSAIDRGTVWEVSVKDNGIGIEEQNLHKIFEIFNRLHSKDEFSGTGIGLATCKKIVERHGGKIWAESKKGQGSTFYFTLLKKEEE